MNRIGGLTMSPLCKAGRVRGLLAGALALGLAACGGKGETAPPEQAPVVVGPENIVPVDSTEVVSGPSFSGQLAAENSATVRSQVSGTVEQTFMEEGQTVSQGARLVSIDAAAIRDAAQSARSAVQSAQAAATLARRNLERSQALQQAGAVAERDVETAKAQAESADAALAEARSRLATAEKNLANTEPRSPFAGVVSSRPVNQGDVVQPGTALATVVDPSSLRLEASVPAAALLHLRVGAPVDFTVSGFGDRTFRGTVERINPVVDPATRQARIYVQVPNQNRQLAAGLFAEGRVALQSRRTVAIPQRALDTRAGPPSVLRVRRGTVERVPVQTGLQDDLADMVEVTDGLRAGDTVLAGTAQGIPSGSRVELQRSTEPVPGDSGAAMGGR